MHESGLARDLLTKASAEAGDAEVRSLRLEVGAMSGIGPDHLADTIARVATERWGYAPEVAVTANEDPMAEGATGVRLTAVGV